MPTLREIIEAHVPPHLQPYIARMVGKEGISGKDSPTGAAGPLQFTRGTGKKYGLVGPQGDNRRDPEANIKAGVTLTMDNAAILRNGLGREPTYSELALAHQQGPETAVKMLTGTGNASRANLAVNNVNPNASPQEAARTIMNYYGFDKQPPGLTMFNPNNPGAFNFQPPTGSVAGAATGLSGFVPPGVSLASNPVSTEVPATPATFAQRALGADEMGGKGTPYANAMEGLGDVAKGLKPATDPKLNELLPSSAGVVDQRIASQQPLAQNILTQMIQSMQARRGMR